MAPIHTVAAFVRMRSNPRMRELSVAVFLAAGVSLCRERGRFLGGLKKFQLQPCRASLPYGAKGPSWARCPGFLGRARCPPLPALPRGCAGIIRVQRFIMVGEPLTKTI